MARTKNEVYLYKNVTTAFDIAEDMPEYFKVFIATLDGGYD